jgi:hypothetical protein
MCRIAGVKNVCPGSGIFRGHEYRGVMSAEESAQPAKKSPRHPHLHGVMPLKQKPIAGSRWFALCILSMLNVSAWEEQMKSSSK